MASFFPERGVAVVCGAVVVGVCGGRVVTELVSTVRAGHVRRDVVPLLLWVEFWRVWWRL
jgi:hypothetical protein